MRREEAGQRGKRMSAKGLFIVLVTFTGKKRCIAMQGGSCDRGKAIGSFVYEVGCRAAEVWPTRQLNM